MVWKDIYVVAETLPGAPLSPGEEVAIGKRSTFDIFTGDLLGIDVVRSTGEIVRLNPGCGVLLLPKE